MRLYAPLRPGRAAIIVGIVLLLLLLFLYGVRGGAPMEGRSAPGFELALYDGSRISLDALRGQVVVINFWASWCQPCREEAPALERVWRTYRARGVRFVGINAKDVPRAALAFVEQFDISYPNGPDPHDRISRAYRVFGYPETYVIDAQGRVQARYIGAIDEVALGATLDGLLSR